MQIDFHHAVTYILCRWAGFSVDEARIIAHAAQYVDDANHVGAVLFINGECFTRTASAHEALDWNNGDKADNVFTWVPFHFMPGNDTPPPHVPQEMDFAYRMLCRPDSMIAREMLCDAFTDKGKAWALHRLGIAMHVYADTWAHQGFAGIQHKINVITSLDDTDKQGGFWRNQWEYVKDMWEKIGNWFSRSFPLGHATALCMPDYPFKKWHYTDAFGNVVKRDNCGLFLDAAAAMIRVLRVYRALPEGSDHGRVLQDIADAFDIPGHGLSDSQSRLLQDAFQRYDDEDAGARHEKWIHEIHSGAIPDCLDQQLEYLVKGTGSWRDDALGPEESNPENKLARYRYYEGFLETNWSLFHRALYFHRDYVRCVLLPKYGLCAA